MLFRSEEVERYLDMPAPQFAYSLLTRSQRISHENLRLRDPKWLGAAEEWFQRQVGGKPGRRPMFAPFRLREMELSNRIVVSPMAQYKAKDGCPTDWHFVHYAERAKGGAGLIYTEMTCVSPEGRISLGCPGLYEKSHEAAWRRLVDFVHAETPAKICCQIGHAGRKASTQLGWENDNAPLKSGNWPVMSASAIAWSKANQVPRAIDRADMDRVKAQFVATGKVINRYGRPVTIDEPLDHIFISYYGQSTGVDVTMLGFKQVIDTLAKKAPRVRPIFLLHDSILFDLPK